MPGLRGVKIYAAKYTPTSVHVTGQFSRSIPQLPSRVPHPPSASFLLCFYFLLGSRRWRQRHLPGILYSMKLGEGQKGNCIPCPTRWQESPPKRTGYTAPHQPKQDILMMLRPPPLDFPFPSFQQPFWLFESFIFRYWGATLLVYFYDRYNLALPSTSIYSFLLPIAFMPAIHWCCSLAESSCWSVDVSQSSVAGYAGSKCFYVRLVSPHSADIISLMAYSPSLMWQTVFIWEFFACCVYCSPPNSPAGVLILVPFAPERDNSFGQDQ